MKFLSKDVGVMLTPRGENDNHVMVTLLDRVDRVESLDSSEDEWVESVTFSAAYLQDLIASLVDARTELELSEEFKEIEFGYEFKNKGEVK